MSKETKTCCWCKKTIAWSANRSIEFSIKFLDSFGYDEFDYGGWGFEASDMCSDCGEKLFVELEKIGISLREIDF